MLWLRAAIAGLSAVTVIACGPREPQTDAERLARGKELVHQMSEHLAAARQITVSFRRARGVVQPSGQEAIQSSTIEVAVRRPDRLHSKEAGEKNLELWYDGKNLTAAFHLDKVFALAPMPETLDRSMDAVAERYDAPFPAGDLFHSSAEKALLSDSTTGGYAGREDVDGTACHHLVFQDAGVDWELWLPVEGEPLPKRFRVVRRNRKGAPISDLTFASWNLTPQVADAMFVPSVPEDYEGIAMLQRAAAIKSTGQESAEARPSPPAGKQ